MKIESIDVAETITIRFVLIIFIAILFTIRIRRRRYAAIATVERQTIKHQFSPGKTLDFFENPDHVIDIPIDHALLQDGHVYKSYGYMRRQVVYDSDQKKAVCCYCYCRASNDQTSI
jgi:hypothetical protein